MSIQLITGVPGAGKSYYAMYHIAQMLESDKNFLIVTNISGINIVDARLLIVDFNEIKLTNAFQANYIEQLRKDYSLDSETLIYYYIDEAQRYIPPDLKCVDTVFFFDYHRHYGIEINIITQDFYKISKKISTLSDLEIRAVSQKINPLPIFLYNIKAGGEKIDQKRLRKKDSVFKMYKSFMAGGSVEKKRKLTIMIGLFIFLCIILALLFTYTFRSSFASEVKEHKENINNIRSQKNTNTEIMPITSDIKPAKNISMVPIIKKYDTKTNHIYYYDKKLKANMHCGFDIFLSKYPPMFFNYSYFKHGNILYIIDNEEQEYIYPFRHPLHIVEDKSLGAGGDINATPEQGLILRRRKD